MLEFAVAVEGVTEDGMGTWVLAIDGDRVLIVHADKTLHWHPMSECTVVKLANAEVPRPVFIVQPQPGVVLPNRAERRRLMAGNGA